MFLLTVLLLSGVSIIQTKQIENQYLSPYDLEDEVRAQLEGVKAVVQGSISAGFDSLDNLITLFNTDRDNLVTEATVNIQQEYETLNQQLTTVKDLANTANQNIESCLTQEPIFHLMPNSIIYSLSYCANDSKREILIIQNDARYFIDTLVNEVGRLDFQITACRGEFLCLSPLVTEIELTSVNVPQKVGKEVDNAGVLLDDLKVVVKGCVDPKVSSYVATASFLLDDIINCINKLLN